MQVNQSRQYKSNVNFGAVIPVKVFIRAGQEDLPTTDPQKIKKAVRQLIGILQKHKNHPKADAFMREFSQNGSDYRIPLSSVDSQTPIIRNLISNIYQYLFTGEQVNQLNSLAPEIGKAKGVAKAQSGITRTFESIQSTKNYFDTAKKFIQNLSLRIKKTETTGEKAPLELRIYTTPQGKPGTSKFKLVLDEIMFKKPGEQRYPVAPLSNKPESVPPVQLDLFRSESYCSYMGKS